MSTNNDEFTKVVRETIERISPLLKGKPPPVQGAVLADLLGMWLAGFGVKGDAIETINLRAKLLAEHCRAVRELTEENAKILGTDVLFK